MKVEELSDAALAWRPHRISGPVADVLLGHGAISSARAIPYSPDDPAASRALEDLRKSQVVKWTMDGRCWFDLRAYYAIQAERERKRALMAIPLAIIAAIVATRFYIG